MPSLRSFLFRFLRCLPFFRSHRRLFFAFFFCVAIFGHAVRLLSVHSKPIMQRPAYQLLIDVFVRPEALIGIILLRMPNNLDTITDISSQGSNILHPRRYPQCITAMAATLNQNNPETSAHLELRAIEKMIGALCEHIGNMICDARFHSKRASRERTLQLEVFAERRTQALQLLNTTTCEPHETRISRFEKLLEALECSRAYFRPREIDSAP